MTLQEALSRAILQLEAADIGAARLSAESLMMFTLKCDRAHLYAHPERELTPVEYKAFQSAVAERATGRPLQYITGHQEFWGLDFLVNSAVLIPRPETEHLVEAALDLIRVYPHGSPRIIDVGTGSGCIILAVAHSLAAQQIPAQLQGTDISAEALHVAEANRRRLQLTDRVKFNQADLLDGESAAFDFILSNPPYVGFVEQDKVQREVRDYEQRVAVFAGDHGLDIYRRFIPQAHTLLRPSGWLLIEIGYSIEQQVRELLALHSWTETRTVPDLQGIPRVLMARK
jgi:release factor glutamine methyltransferase